MNYSGFGNAKSEYTSNSQVPYSPGLFNSGYASTGVTKHEFSPTRPSFGGTRTSTPPHVNGAENAGTPRTETPQHQFSDMLQPVIDEHRSQVRICPFVAPHVALTVLPMQLSHMRDQYRTLNEAKETEVNTLRNEVRRLVEENEELRSSTTSREREKDAQYEKLNERLKSSQQELSKVSGNLGLSKQSETMYSEKIASLEASSRVLKNLNEQYQHTIRSLEDEKNTFMKENESHLSKIRSLQSEKNASELRMSQLNDLVAEGKRGYDALEKQRVEEHERSSHQLRLAQDKVQSVTESFEAVRRAKSQVEQQFRESEKRRQQEEENFAQRLQSQKDEFLRVQNEASNSFRMMENKFETLHNQMMLLNEQYSQSQSAKRSAEDNVNTLKQDLESVQREKSAATDTLQKQLIQMQRENNDITSALQEVRKEKLDLMQKSQDQQALLSDNIGRLTRELEVLRSNSGHKESHYVNEIKDLHSNLDGVNLVKAELEGRLRAREDELASTERKLQSVLEEKERDLERFEASETAKDEERMEFRRLIEEQVSQFNSLQSMYDHVKNQENALSIRVQAIEEEKNAQAQTFNLQYQTHSEAGTVLRRQVELQRAQLEALQQETNQLRNQRSNFQKEIQTLKQKLASDEMQSSNTLQELQLLASSKKDEAERLREQLEFIRREKDVQIESLNSQVATLEQTNRILLQQRK